jgi:hypothetical protein
MPLATPVASCGPKTASGVRIMERLVRATTEQVAALHRELNALLQDRDVLPTMRVRTRARGGTAQPRDLRGRALYDKLVEMLDPDARAAPSVPSAAAAMTSATGAAPGMVGVLNHLQRGPMVAPLPPELATLDRDALREGSTNQLRALKEAFADKGESAIDRVTIDIVAGVLDYVFDDLYLPDQIKTVFGRLQIPMLKAALLDRSVLSDPQHPTRRFLDTLAQASVDLQPESAKGRALIELANRLALRIRDNFGDDLRIFETAKAELDAYLDVERADADRQLAAAVAQDERADARGEAQAALDARLAGRSVPPEVRDFLDHEYVELLTTICLEDGREAPPRRVSSPWSTISCGASSPRPTPGRASGWSSSCHRYCAASTGIGRWRKRRKRAGGHYCPASSIFISAP